VFPATTPESATDFFAFGASAVILFTRIPPACGDPPFWIA
jgi:hypothetical protein